METGNPSEFDRLTAALRRQGKRLAAGKEHLKQREVSFAASLKEMSSHIAELQRELESRDLRIRERDGQIAERDRQIQSITSTLGWRLLSRYGRIKHGLILPILRRLGLAASRPQGGLTVCLDKGFPERIPVGRGTALHIAGWCYDARHKIRSLRFVVGGVRVPVKAAGMARPEVAAAQVPGSDPRCHSFRSGFWAIVPFAGVDVATRVVVEIQAEFVGGGTASQVVARPLLEPVRRSASAPAVHEDPDHLARRPLGSAAPVAMAPEPLVAICMTTFNPPIPLFRRQIESIVAQTHTQWICIIRDDASRPEIYDEIARIAACDPRFRLSRSEQNVGFYRNFEGCLSSVPHEADFVALCDHDDYWHPDKLTRLLSRFDAGTTLVYSDMNIVDERGQRLAQTYWTTRRNNYRNFASLILANTITGAASMIPSDLLDLVLPFPERIGEAYHDHWIGCIALATGNVNYVDSALYDYVQHSSNVLGHFAPPEGRLGRTIARMREGARLRRPLREKLADWQGVYQHDLLRLQVIAQSLLLRCEPALSPARKRVLERIVRLDRSVLALGWLWIRSLRNLSGPTETMGAEQRLFKSVLWKGLYSIASKLRLRSSQPHARSKAQGASVGLRTLEPQVASQCLDGGPACTEAASQDIPVFASKLVDSGCMTCAGVSPLRDLSDPILEPESEPAASGPEEQTGVVGPAQQVSDEPKAELNPEPRAPEPPPGTMYWVELIRQKIAPLKLAVSPGAPARVNLLIPTVDSRYVFGGYITKFNLARHLADAGFSTRVVAVDHCEKPPSCWAEELRGFHGIEDLFLDVEGACAFDRSIPLQVSPDDVFIATTWWTAHVAHQAVRDLCKQRFLYLIQEYEPFTFPMGGLAAIADQSYTFPHLAIFSTAFLRDYFEENARGVFAESGDGGRANSVAFENAITDVGEVTVADISQRQPRKLLLYARPEPHAARNMFEIAVLALSRALEAGYFKGEWEFNGIGTVGPSAEVPLAPGVSMKLLPREDQESYRGVLRSHDLGVSLMYTPHPGLVPIEMASAGMLVVTNTYANKTRDRLARVSQNIIAAQPTIPEITQAVRRAIEQIADYEARIRGSHVAWSRDWFDAFRPEVWSAIERFLEAAR